MADMKASTIKDDINSLVKKGKTKGFVTYDELNKALPQGDILIDDLDSAISTFSDECIAYKYTCNQDNGM